MQNKRLRGLAVNCPVRAAIKKEKDIAISKSIIGG
jgi:hypothetical protein